VGEAVLASDETYWMVRADGVLERTPDGRERLLVYERERTGGRETTLPATERSTRSERLLAYLQHYTMSMINNSFYREPTHTLGAGQ
jgi:hypothetical protein